MKDKKWGLSFEFFIQFLTNTHGRSCIDLLALTFLHWHSIALAETLLVSTGETPLIYVQ